MNSRGYELLLYISMAYRVKTVRMVVVNLTEFFNSWCPSIWVVGRVITMVFHAVWNIGFIVIGLELVVSTMNNYSVIEL